MTIESSAGSYDLFSDFNFEFPTVKNTLDTNGKRETTNLVLCKLGAFDITAEYNPSVKVVI